MPEPRGRDCVVDAAALIVAAERLVANRNFRVEPERASTFMEREEEFSTRATGWVFAT